MARNKDGDFCLAFKSSGTRTITKILGSNDPADMARAHELRALQVPDNAPLMIADHIYTRFMNTNPEMKARVFNELRPLVDAYRAQLADGHRRIGPFVAKEGHRLLPDTFEETLLGFLRDAPAARGGPAGVPAGGPAADVPAPADVAPAQPAHAVVVPNMPEDQAFAMYVEACQAQRPPKERPIAKDFKAAYQAMHGNKEVQLSRTQGELLYHLEGFFPRGAH